MQHRKCSIILPVATVQPGKHFQRYDLLKIITFPAACTQEEEGEYSHVPAASLFLLRPRSRESNSLQQVVTLKVLSRLHRGNRNDNAALSMLHLAT